MPRTMTSMASGNSSMNFFSRRFVRKVSTQRGRPKAAGEAERRAPAQMPAPSRNTSDERDQPERRR